MLVHYKQLARRFNALRTKKRYKEKRIRRAYLTEAFNDGELALYKPAYSPYKVFTDKKIIGHTVIMPNDPIKEVTIHSPRYSLPVKFNWFEKFLLWIKKVFR